MSKFCTKCGSQNESDARFCDNCGAPMKTDAPESAIKHSTEVSQGRAMKRKKIVKFGSLFFVATLAIGVMASFFLGDEQPSPEAFKRAANEYLKTHPDVVDNLTCLSNVDFSLPNVKIDQWDYSGKKLYDSLVAAGIYAAPTAVESSTGFFRKMDFQYTQKPEASKFIKGKRLCIASGATISSIKTFPIVESTLGKYTHVRIDYQFLDSPVWLSGELENIAKRNLQKGSQILRLVIRSHKWVIADDSEMEREKKLMQEKVNNSRNSFFTKIANVFNTENPLNGAWTSTTSPNSGWTPTDKEVQLIFNGREYFINAYLHEVSFEVNNNFVLIRRPERTLELQGDHYVMKLKNDSPVTESFRIIDPDRIALSTTKGERIFVRIKNN